MSELLPQTPTMMDLPGDEQLNDLDSSEYPVSINHQKSGSPIGSTEKGPFEKDLNSPELQLRSGPFSERAEFQGQRLAFVNDRSPVVKKALRRIGTFEIRKFSADFLGKVLHQDAMNDTRNYFIRKLKTQGVFNLYGDSFKEQMRVFFTQTVLVHFICILLSLGVYLIQTNLDSGCFFPKYCTCDYKEFGKKSLYLLRQFFTQLNKLTVSYYTVFCTDTHGKVMKLLFIVVNYLFLGAIVFLSDGNQEFKSLTHNIIILSIMISCFVYVFFKQKMTIRGFKETYSVPIRIFVFLTLQYYFVTDLLPFLKRIFYQTLALNQASYLFALLVAIFVFITTVFYEMIIKKYEQFLKEKKFTFNSLLIYSKLVFTIILTLNLTNLNTIEFLSLGFFINMASFLSFIVYFHTGFSAGEFVFKKVFYRVFYKEKYTYEIPDSISFRIMSFQHFEIMFVYISRIFLLYYTRTWLDQYKFSGVASCDLSVSENVLGSFENITITIATDIIVTVLLMSLLYRKKLCLSKYIVEDINYINRVIITFSFHFLFEFYISSYHIA